MIVFDWEKKIVMIHFMNSFSPNTFVFHEFTDVYFKFNDIDHVWFGDLNNDLSKMNEDEFKSLITLSVKLKDGKIATFYNHVDYEQYKNDIVIIDIFNKTKGAK